MPGRGRRLAAARRSSGLQTTRRPESHRRPVSSPGCLDRYRVRPSSISVGPSSAAPVAAAHRCRPGRRPARSTSSCWHEPNGTALPRFLCSLVAAMRAVGRCQKLLDLCVTSEPTTAPGGEAHTRQGFTFDRCFAGHSARPPPSRLSGHGVRPGRAYRGTDKREGTPDKLVRTHADAQVSGVNSDKKKREPTPPVGFSS